MPRQAVEQVLTRLRQLAEQHAAVAVDRNDELSLRLRRRIEALEDDPHERQRPRADLRGALLPGGPPAMPELAFESELP